MKVFEKILVAEGGLTKNVDYSLGLPIVFTDEFIDALVSRGNESTIRCRRTHNGDDMLDNIIGKWSNFIKDGGNAYADLYIIDSLSDAPDVITLIEQAPELINSSIVVTPVGVVTEEAYNYTGIEELYSIDMVGIGGATSSLFNNQNKDKMGFLKQAVAFLQQKKAQAFASQTVTDKDGKELRIEMVGEVLALGDVVYIGEETAPAGAYEIMEGDDTYRLIVVEGGAIDQIEKVEPEAVVEPESPAPKETFSAEIKEFKAMLSKHNEAITALGAKLEAMSKFSATPKQANINPLEKPATGITIERAKEIKNSFRKK